MMHYALSTMGGFDGLFNGENVLVSAGRAYENPGADRFSIHVPDDPNHLIVDSGGYQAAVHWSGVEACERGLPGVYPYTPKEMHTWADEIGADVVAGRDIACERATHLFEFEEGHAWPGDYRDRLWKSYQNQVQQRGVYESGDFGHDFMPVIQGLKPQEYEEFTDRLIKTGFDKFDRFGVGTVCKRSDLDEILEIVLAIRDRFPNKWLHLFGASLNIYKDPRFDGLFDSSDTAAWNWGADSKAHKKKLFEKYQGKVEDYSAGAFSQGRIAQATQ